MTDIKVYTSNSRNQDVIRKELARRERVKAKRKENPKYKGTVLTLGALSVLAGLWSTSYTKNMMDTKMVEHEISSPQEYSKADEKGEKKIIGDIFLKDEDSKEEEKSEETVVVKPEEVESNVNEVLEAGDVVEFERAYVGKYEYSDEYGGTWSVNNESGNLENNNWCFAMHREVGNYGYVTIDSLEEFKPYLSATNGIDYRADLNGKWAGKIDCAIGDVVYVDDSQIYTSNEGYKYYKYLIQNEYEEQGRTKYNYLVVYAGTTVLEKSNKEFSLGLVKNKTAMRTSPEIKGDVYEYGNDNYEKGVKYIVDISSYTPATFPDYMDTLKTLKAKGLLGGVIMEIARSYEGEGFSIGCITDGAELDAKNYAIASTTSNTYTYSMGDYNQFKNYVEQTMEICPVGFYVFVDTINQDKANQLADIVCETEKKLSNDIPGYNQATKFPIMVDVETGGYENRQERTDAVIGFINRLADLNVINNQYMFYTSPSSVVAKKENINSGTQITCIEDVQEGTPNLTLINVGACYVDKMLNISSNKEEYKQNLEPENLMKSMYATSYYTNTAFMSQSNIAQADIMQCMGNINNDTNNNLKLNTQVIDISACTTDTYNAILNGTFKGHEGVYLANMSDSIQKYKSINGKNTSLEAENNYNNIEQENERE